MVPLLTRSTSPPPLTVSPPFYRKRRHLIAPGQISPMATPLDLREALEAPEGGGSGKKQRVDPNTKPPIVVVVDPATKAFTFPSKEGTGAVASSSSLVAPAPRATSAQKAKAEAAAEDDDESDASSEGHNELCEVCAQGGELLCCDTCSLVFHPQCCRPELPDFPDDDWSCAFCVIDGTCHPSRAGYSVEHAKSHCAEMRRLGKALEQRSFRGVVNKGQKFRAQVRWCLLRSSSSQYQNALKARVATFSLLWFLRCTLFLFISF